MVMSLGKERLTADFLKKLESCSIVSFDIFGTLLVRAVGKPEEVFDIVESARTGVAVRHDTEFRTLRAKAGDSASAGKILNIEEIYERVPGLSESEVPNMVSLEERVEETLLFPNLAVMPLYEAAVRSGKKIIAISDMYLPSDWLLNILHIKGFGSISHVYVSCEYGCEKKTGDLFCAVAADLHCPIRDIFHVGDSITCDIIGAKRAAVSCLYVGKPLYEKTLQKVFHCRTRNPLIDNQKNSLHSIGEAGRECFGPLLVSIAQWIHLQLHGHDGRIFFLARDSKIILDSFQILFPEDAENCSYLYVSRRSTNLACASNPTDLNRLFEEVNVPRYISFTGLLDILGVDKKDWSYLRPRICNLLDPDYPINRSELLKSNSYQQAWEMVAPVVKSVHDEQQVLLTAYLQEAGLREHDILVDIGWHGSIQRSLERLLGFTLRGLYVGTSDTSDLNAEGFLYRNGSGAHFAELLSGFGGLFETFFFAGHGTTLSYARTADGVCKPILGACELTGPQLLEIQDFQQGALDYVKEFSTTSLQRIVEIEKTEAYLPIVRLGTRPTSDELDVFGQLPYLNHGAVSPLVPSVRRMHYLRHPKEAVSEFFDCNWKIGFMKRLFVLPMRYDVIFITARRIFKSKKK